FILNSLDPLKEKKKEAKAKSEEVLGKLGRNLKLNEYEEVILSEVIFSDEIAVDFKRLDSIIQSLRESVIYPLCYPQLFTSTSGLLGVPKGVLLHGPPGCGKTMLAKALARESGATFINLHVSTLTDKWFGESNKLVAAVFSVAKKLQPCIIFIDEIDAFLRERRSNDHEDNFDYDKLVSQTANFSGTLLSSICLFSLLSININFTFSKGSDLKEACRNAAMIPIREYMRDHATPEGDLKDIDPK
ncbi:16555_t:CDS:2, partial [Racocetra fulgida]